MRRDPIGQCLRPAGLDISVVRCAQCGDEDLRRPNFAGLRADHIHGVPRIIDKQALACRVPLTHHRRQAALPPGVELAISAVPIPIRMDGAILFPEQSQGHTLPAQLAVDIGPIWLRNVAGRCSRLMRIKLMLQVSVGQIIRQWPGQSRHISPPEILRHRRPPERQALRHTTPRQSFRTKPQGFSDLPHWRSLHKAPSRSQKNGS